MLLSPFSCTYLSSVCLLWWTPCSNLLLSFKNWGGFPEFWEFFTYSGCKFFIRYILPKHLLFTYGFPYHFLNSGLQRAQVLKIDEVWFINVLFFLKKMLSLLYIRNHCLTQGHKDFLLCFLLALEFWVSHLVLWSILIFYLVSGVVEILSAFFHTVV